MSRRYVLAFLLAVVALVAAREFLVAKERAEASANAGAEWIWSPPRGRPGMPVVMFAAKDFELDFKPVRAELEIAGDEEYHLMVNGRGVAAGRYRSRLDAYPVGNILRLGANRLLVELRSARGVGGLLVRLHVSGAEGRSTTIVSDGSWRVMRRYVQGVSRPTSATWGEPVRVWGAPPTGRWPASTKVHRALTLRRLQGGRARRPMPAWRNQQPGHRWLPAEEFGTEPLGPWVTFDFGRPRTGFVNLNFADNQASNSFLFYGLRRPKEGLDNPDEVVIRSGGRAHWTSAAPAKFRFITVVGAPQVTRAEVVPVVEALASELVARQPVEPLFGVDRSLTLMSPVEYEIRRKLESIPSLARRKEG